jgi:hypothetical protein
LAAGRMQVKRLDAQTVAPENKFAFAGIPNCESKHAAQFFDKTLAIFLVKTKDNLRVRRGVKGVAATLEFGAQFAGVVGDPGLAIRAGHGHPAAVAQIDDGEARVNQETRCEFLDTLAIRAPVFHGSSHKVRGRAQGIVRVGRSDPCDAAHAAYFPISASRQRGTPRRFLGIGTG